MNDQHNQREELIVQLRCKIKDLTNINTDLEDKLFEKFEILSVSNRDMIAKKDVEICQLNNKIIQLQDKLKNLEEKLKNQTQAQIKNVQ